MVFFVKAMLALRPTGVAFPSEQDHEVSHGEALNYENYLIISLGTGTSKMGKKYDAKTAEKWGILGWLYSEGSSPLVDAFTYAGADMVDLHMSFIFKATKSEHNYLRIQVSSFINQSQTYFCSIHHVSMYFDDEHF